MTKAVFDPSMGEGGTWVAVEGEPTWQAVYDLETGALLSTGTEVAAPLPEGCGVVALEGEPNFAPGEDKALVWDPKELSFVVVKAEPAPQS